LCNHAPDIYHQLYCPNSRTSCPASKTHQHPNSELEDFKSAVQMLPMRFGDNTLRFNGIGENVTWGSYNNDNMSDAQKEQLYQVAKWAADRGLTLTIHWQNDRSVGSLLDVFDRVTRDVPLAPLRWSIAHLNDASPATIERMRSLGLGWTMQDFMYFVGDSVLRERGSEAAGRMPPIGSAIRTGLPIGGGTDAHRVSTYNPFVVLQWMIDGRTVSGTATRTASELPSREDALRIYTKEARGSRSKTRRAVFLLRVGSPTLPSCLPTS
jgi:predicted amidohydrolase YtcJ